MDSLDDLRAAREETAASSQTEGQANALIEIGKRCELFADERGDAYAAIPLSAGSQRVRRLSSREFKNYLCGEYYKHRKTTARSEKVAEAMAVLEGQALHEGERRDLCTRFWHGPDGLWIDRGDAEWSAFHVTADGWTEQRRPPVRFRRASHVNALPRPEGGGRLEDLFRFLNVADDDDRLLMLAWLVAVPFARVPRPILLLHGVKGAAKTTSAKVLRSLVDPSVADVLSRPRNEEHLAQVLDHHAVPIFDNLGSQGAIPDWLSDAFCRAVTGEASSKRKLYSDDDDVLYQFKRPMILTGINVPATAPDLLDRTLLVELRPISQLRRREESVFWAEFEAARARLLGALLEALVATMRTAPSLKLPGGLQRMADFTRIGAAFAEAHGYGATRFLTAYARSLGRQTSEIIEADPVADAIFALRGKAGAVNGTAQVLFEGTASELLQVLRPDPHDKTPGFPKNAAALGKRLNIIAPTLEEVGIEIRRDPTRESRQLEILYRGIVQSPVAPVADVTRNGAGAPVETPATAAAEDCAVFEGRGEA